MFDSMRIRSKLGLALAVPLTALVALSGVMVRSSADDARTASDQADRISEQVTRANASLSPSGVITSLQNERDRQAADLAGIDAATMGRSSRSTTLEGSFDDQRRRTDSATGEFRALVAQLPESSQEAAADALKALASVAQIRRDVDDSTTPHTIANAPFALTIAERYDAVIDAVFGANAQLAAAVDDARLRDGAELMNIFARDREYGERLVTQLAVTVLVADQAAARGKAVAAEARVAEYDQQLRDRATGPYRHLVTNVLDDPQFVAYRRALAVVEEGGTPASEAILGQATATNFDQLDGLSTAIADQLTRDGQQLRAEADQAAADARQRAATLLAVVGGALVAAVGIALLASRSISGPLRRLAQEAEDMAEHRLPEAVRSILDTPHGEDVAVPHLPEVETSGGAEIGEVAVALNSVQASAAGLAVEQTTLRRNVNESFVNLGRRNQNLLSRQIDSIVRMERRASDPDLRAQLQDLDHLATRMRRNAESLLLLGGLESNRQWARPQPVRHVVDNALGEVEEHSRVSITRVQDATVVGWAVADLTHLLAELVENALNFSPPTTTVEILARWNQDHYTIAVIDSGLGMSADALRLANERLAGRESFTVAPSRYLGHHVVGVQAARLGISVRLQDSPLGGVTAMIDLTAVVSGPEGPGEGEAVPTWAMPEAYEHDRTADRGADEVPAPDEDLVADGDRAASHDADRWLPEEAPVAEDAPVAEEAPVAGPAWAVVAPDDTTSATDRLTAAVPGPPVAPEATEATDRLPLAGAAAEADLDRSAPPAATPAPAPATTASGYRRRVRGASIPRTDVRQARGGTGGAAAGTAPQSEADSVRNLLTGLQAGTDAGRAAARAARTRVEDGAGSEGAHEDEEEA